MPDAPSNTIASQLNTAPPEDIAGRSFPSARRGLDPEAVRRYLDELAAHLRALRARETELRARLSEAERRAETPQLDEQTLSAALGTETGRVLQAAHQAARDIVERAEERASALVTDAESAIAARSHAAEEQAGTILDAARAETASALAATREECQAMVDEAREARRRILADLAERRRALRVQLEQLRAGKDALAGVFGAVGAAVEVVSTRLTGAEEEARAAADAAGRSPTAIDDEPPVEVLVAEALARALPTLPPAPRSEASTTPVPVPVPVPVPTPVPAPPSVQAPGAPETVRSPGLASDAGAITDAPEGDGETSEAPSGGAEESGGALDELFARLRADQDDIDELVRVEPPATANGAATHATTAGGLGDPDPSAASVQSVTPSEPAPSAHDEPPADNSGGARPADDTAETGRADRADRGAGGDDALHDRSADEVVAEAAASVTVGTSRLDAAASSEEAISDDTAETEPDRLGAASVGGASVTVEEGLIAARSELLDPPAAELARALKRVLRVEQNELLDACRLAGTGSSARAVLEMGGAAARIAQASSVALTAAFRAGGAFLGDVGGNASPTVVARDTAALSRALGDELASTLSRRLLEGFEKQASEDLDAIGLANAVFREWRGARVEVLSGDYATRAFSAGTLSRARPAGVELRWIVDDGDLDCPDCDDNALAGPLTSGEAFPTGHPHPPVHAGCRCILAPPP